jgi:hypothetical protein
MRREEEKRATRNMVPGMDSVEPKRRSASQTTATGFELPVPSTEQVLRDMQKASRKVPPKKR